MLETFFIIQAIFVIGSIIAFAIGGGSKKEYHLETIKVKNDSYGLGYFFVKKAYRRTGGAAFFAEVVDVFGKEEKILFASTQDELETEILREYKRLQAKYKYPE